MRSPLLDPGNIRDLPWRLACPTADDQWGIVAADCDETPHPANNRRAAHKQMGARASLRKNCIVRLLRLSSERFDGPLADSGPFGVREIEEDASRQLLGAGRSG